MADYAARHPVTVRSVEHFDGGDGGAVTFDVGPGCQDGDLILAWMVFTDTSFSAPGSIYQDMVDEGWNIASYRNVIGVADAYLTLARTWHTGDATSWTYGYVGTYTGGACGGGDYWVHREAFVITVDLPFGGYFGFTASADGFFSVNNSPYPKQENAITAWSYYIDDIVPGDGLGGYYGFTSTGDAHATLALARKNQNVNMTEAVTLTTNATGTVVDDGTTLQIAEYDTCVANGPFNPRRFTRGHRYHNLNEAGDNTPNRSTWTATWADVGFLNSVDIDVAAFGFMRLGGPQLIDWSVLGTQALTHTVAPGTTVPWTFEVEHDRWDFAHVSVFIDVFPTYTGSEFYDDTLPAGDLNASGDLIAPPDEGTYNVVLSAYDNNGDSHTEFSQLVVEIPHVEDTSAQFALRSRHVDLQELPYQVSRKQLRRQ